MIELEDSRRCLDPHLGKAVPALCFGDLDDAQREAVTVHVMSCDVCWQEVQRLEAAVRAVRFDPLLPDLPFTAEAVSSVKFSGQIEQAFAGHVGFALMAAAFYAALYVASVWTELGYAFDRFGWLVLMLTPVVFTWISAATLTALWVSWRVTRSGGRRGLELSVLALTVALGALLGGLFFALPHTPTIVATFATRSAFDGYVKNVAMYFVILALAFVLLPFHVVVALTRELNDGRVTNTLALLSHDAQAFHPRGVWFVRPKMLGVLLLLAAAVGYSGTNYMLDALQPSAYSNLFTRALYFRVGLWFVVAGTGLAWYARRLQDLKQIALLMKRLESSSVS
jgi:hypothetical protein